jgi:hypothetical protein
MLHSSLQLIWLLVWIRARAVQEPPSVRLDVAVQPNPVDCGFHVVLNARSLTKYMLDRNEGAPVANLKDDCLAATTLSPAGGPPMASFLLAVRR